MDSGPYLFTPSEVSTIMSVLDSVGELTTLLERWEKEVNGTTTDPVPIITRIAELVENETASWYKMDPDPFDDRHPGRADPNCSLGHLLKAVFKNETFMNKLVSNYVIGSRDCIELQEVSCRLLYDLLPGLETTIVYQENEPLVRKLITWAQGDQEPLASYAIGLLGAAMEIQEIAANFKEENATMVPFMLKRLHALKDQAELEAQQEKEDMLRQKTSPSKPKEINRPFANLQKNNSITFEQPLTQTKTELNGPVKSDKEEGSSSENTDTTKSDQTGPINEKTAQLNGPSGDAVVASPSNGPSGDAVVASPSNGPSGDAVVTSPSNQKATKSTADVDQSESPPLKKQRTVGPDGEAGSLVKGKFPAMTDLSEAPAPTPKEDSSSCWAEQQAYMIGTYCMQPLRTAMTQRLILQYLTPMGEYQELLTHVFEHRAMHLIFHFIDLKKNTDARLAFDATKYLASLLCHKKFTVEFIQCGGVQRLLEVHRPSVAATGVSMCLYYLAYFEDSMERVCLLPSATLTELVRVVLWLLECSHESGRCHATMFFSLSFSFRVILDLFDQQDGLRKLYNVISTLDIMNIDDPNPITQSDDEVFTSRQAARHVCVALRRYFEAHLFVKAADIHRNQARNEGSSPMPEISPYKASKFAAEVIADNLELLLECLPLRAKWEPVTHVLKLGGSTLLFQLIAMATDWSAYTGKAETIRSALDVLCICSVMPKGLLQLCESIPLPDNVATPAISILLGLAEGEFIPDPEVQKSALNVLNTVVCAPMFRNTSGSGRINNGHGSVQKKLLRKNGENMLTKVWTTVRDNNGIMVLLKLMMTKTPITEADAVRALACKALVGLSRSETIRQIISKLPLFNNGQLQMLMREPVLQDKRQEHLKFCKYGVALIEKVSGKQQNSNIDVSIERIRKADIVAHTKIVYQEKELLHLIQEHLMSKGLYSTAAALQQEAGLPRCSTPPVILPDNPLVFSTPKATPRMNRQFSTPSQSSHLTPAALSSSAFHTPLAGPSSHSNQLQPAAMAPLPIRVNVIQSKVQTPGSALQIKNQTPRKTTIRYKSDSHNITLPFTMSPTSLRKQSVTSEAAASLDKIVTEYLRKQHAACTNPVVTCPPFSLLQPHVCPEPKGKASAPVNMTSRMFRKKYSPPYGGCDGYKSDRKFIYSRFRPVKSFRDTEEDGCFSCCTFSSDEQSLVLGTYAGELKILNIQSQEELGSYVCHNSPLCHCETSRDGRLVVTCSTWGRPLSALWGLNDLFDMLHGFDDDNYMEFSKQTQDKLVGTKEEIARVYDVDTGKMVIKLHDEGKTNNYLWNRATFNPTDDLILNDGVLWDVNSGKSVHKFDKFNPNVSGVFHPNGLEIIINSEVWDLRTFHLLHTVPALDQCQIRFNNTGKVIYGAIHQNDESDMDEERIKSPFGSSFRTFDGADYSNIATIDVKKNIFDLCTDSTDRYIAVVENLRNQETLTEESVCRLYEVGRLKDEEDQDDEEEEEAMNENEGGEEDDEEDDEDDDDEGDDEDFNDDDDNDGDGDENSQESTVSNPSTESMASLDSLLSSLSSSQRSLGNDSDSNSSVAENGNVVEFEVDSSDSDDVNEDLSDEDDDDDDVLFELSDVSSGPWI